MQFKNNGALQKWCMTNVLPEIEKYDNHKKWYLTKMAHLAKTILRVYIPRAKQGDFIREFLNWLYDSHLAPSVFCEMSFMLGAIFVRWYF